MDACTATTCDKSWGRTNFAKVLVNVWATGELPRDVDVVIPRVSGEGEDVVKVVLEYDWEPSQCSICNTFGHKLSTCAKGAVPQPRVTKPDTVDREGFQQPRRKFWRPKAKQANSGGNHAESSNVIKGGNTQTSETMVGVGSIKPSNLGAKQSVDEMAKIQATAVVSTTASMDTQNKGTTTDVNRGDTGGYCTVHAGRTPKGKENGETVKPKQYNGPELIKSVVQTFKNQLQPRRGVVISSSNVNRFSPLNSEESSDEDDMEIIDTDRLNEDSPTVLGSQGVEDGRKDTGSASTSLSQ